MKANKKLFMRKDTRGQVGIGTLIIFIAMVLVAAVAAAVLIQTSGVLQQKAQATGKQATQEVSSNLIIKTIEGIRAKNSSSTATVPLSNRIDVLKVRVGLNVGSAPVDVNQVVISITDGTTANNLIYANNDKSYGAEMLGFNETSSDTNVELLLFNSTVADTGTFNNSAKYYVAEKIRDEDASFSQLNPVMNTGDLITVYIGTTSAYSATSNLPSVATYDAPYSNPNGTLKQSGLDLVTRTTVNIILTPEAGASTTADFVTPSSYGVKEAVQLYP